MADNAHSVDPLEAKYWTEEAIAALWLAERRLGQLGMATEANRVGRIRRELQARQSVDPGDFIEVQRP